MNLISELRTLVDREIAVAVATVVSGGSDVGGKLLVLEDGTVKVSQVSEALADSVAPDAAELIRAERSELRTYQVEDAIVGVFIDVLASPRQVVIVGATHTAVSLTELAKAVGYRVTIIDARAAFARSDRFPRADRVIKGWPEDVLSEVRLDASTYLVLLSHDPKFDEPTLRIALSSEVAYIGAIGSRKTQKDRRLRLEQEGFSAAQLERLYGPVGLDIGGQSAEEIALAILAEITSVRYRRSGGHLRDRTRDAALR